MARHTVFLRRPKFESSIDGRGIRFLLLTVFLSTILLCTASSSLAAGPASRKPHAVFAKKTAASSHKTKYRSVRVAGATRVTIRSHRAPSHRAAVRGATKAGVAAIARRSRAKHLAGSQAQLKKVTLDDALEAPTGSLVIHRGPVEPLSLTLTPAGLPIGNSLSSLVEGADASGQVHDTSGNTVSLTIDPVMQQTAEGLLLRAGVPWGAIVAMDPHTGAIKAIASYSGAEPDGPEVATRGGFPAASLFKIITTSAGVERAGLAGENMISFRGGNYTLSQANYIPDAGKDRRRMSVAEALGRSCNPVFARIALQNFTAQMLQRYAEKFGFNQDLPFDVPLAQSQFSPPVDHYTFARTAAGFGDVTVTPVHAAAMLASLANRGVMMRPYLISRVTSPEGKLLYLAKNVAVRNTVRPETAKEVLMMMQSTVEIGTARRHFVGSRLSNIPIAAKTGTLSGDSPKGVYHWFTAALPANAPDLVISVLVINPGYSRANSVALGRAFLERSYREKQTPLEAVRKPETETPSGTEVSPVAGEGESGHVSS